MKANIVKDLEPLATPIHKLTLLPGNPRRGDIPAVARSLAKFGQRKPVVARRDGTLLAGNHTHQAAQHLGWTHLATVWVDDDHHTGLAYALADNRTSDLGTYDNDPLAALITEVRDHDEELLAATSWDTDAVEELLATIEATVPPVSLTDPDDTPPPPSDPITKPGDLWILGPHRIICGDSRDPDTVERLLDGKSINIAFTSPPYASQRTYDESSGFRPIHPDEYVNWFEDVQANVRAHLAHDGSFFINIKEHTEDGRRHLYVKDLTIAHVRRWGWGFVDELVWFHGGTPGKFAGRFKNGWEPVFHFTSAPTTSIKHRPKAVAYESEHAFGYEAGRRKTATGNFGFHGGDVERVHGVALPSNVLEIRNGRHVGDNTGTIGHEAAFTVRLPEWFIKAYTDARDVVFDPFMGSGSTLLAAHRNDRTAYGTEISPAYCDVICRRYQQHTGTQPTNATTGEPHDFTTAPADQ